MNLQLTQIADNLHPLVADIVKNYRGWLVGSALLRLENFEEPKDYDFIIEDREMYYEAVQYLRENATSESFSKEGAHKFRSQGIVIDIWCQELGLFLSQSKKISYILGRSRYSDELVIMKNI